MSDNLDVIINKLREIHPYDTKYRLHHTAANELERLEKSESFLLACVEAASKDIEYFKAESQSRLDGLRSATEDNRVSLGKVAELVSALEAVISTRNAEARAIKSYENAQANFCQDGHEYHAMVNAMQKASDAEKLAKQAIAKAKG